MPVSILEGGGGFEKQKNAFFNRLLLHPGDCAAQKFHNKPKFETHSPTPTRLVLFSLSYHLSSLHRLMLHNRGYRPKLNMLRLKAKNVFDVRKWQNLFDPIDLE